MKTDSAIAVARVAAVPVVRPAPFASGGVYVNFLTDEETDRVRQAYGPSYDRLAEVKRRYDPGNLFRTNWNIKPV